MSLVGQQFYLLTVIKDSGKRERGHILWESLCQCGSLTLRRGSDLKRGKAISCGCANKELFVDRYATPYKSEISYTAAHKRVSRSKGSASDFKCVDKCGRDGEEWSYKYTDSEAIYSSRTGHYSTDPAHYESRCVPCHRSFDRANTQPVFRTYG